MSDSKIERMQRLVPAGSRWRHWTAVDADFRVDDFVTTEIISHAALADIDARLPDAIRHMKQTRESYEDPAYDIELTLQLWDATVHVVNSVHNNVALMSMTAIEIMERTVRFYGKAIPYEIVDIPLTGLPAPVMSGHDVITTSVRKSWLDQHYADWQKRYTLAADLNLDADTITRFMLNLIAPVQPQLALPGSLLP